MVAPFAVHARKLASSASGPRAALGFSCVAATLPHGGHPKMATCRSTARGTRVGYSITAFGGTNRQSIGDPQSEKHCGPSKYIFLTDHL